MKNLDELTSWRSDWSGLRVAVLGLGVTGFSVADTLVELGADVLVAASSAADEQRKLLDVIGGSFLQHDLTAVPPEVVEFCPEVIVTSPGFHPDNAVLLWAAAEGIAVWGDIELAWRIRDKVQPAAEWVLVTGTNGKTTTTQLVTHILEGAGKRVAAVGNIGIPVLDAVRYPAGFDVLVVELSSYQLHWLNRTEAGTLSPWASVCLNIDDDHLDWHGSRAEYELAKGRVYTNTKVAAVYNRADAATIRMVENAEVVEGCRAIGFGLDTPGPSDFGVVDGILIDRAFLEDRRNSALELSTRTELDSVGLGAPHSVNNALAAAALVRSLDIDPAVIRAQLLTFTLDAHRTQLVSEIGGVAFINDSKATNPHAAAASLRAYESVVWIVGGMFKGVDVDALVKSHISRLSAAVLIGIDRNELRAAFQRHAPTLPLFEVDTADTGEVMTAAVALSASAARPGDVVLLAPAAASFDQFASYGDRGTQFAAAVLQLKTYRKGDADGDSDSAHPAP
ncbi:MAG: murD [Glaciihabitans sp.]|nr:murD [Glaciihabitans sp.]